MAGESAAQTTMCAGHGTGTSTSNNTIPTPSEPSSPPPPSSAADDVEMSVLDASKGTATTGAGSHSGLLNDVSIPESSPIDASFSSMPAGTENSRPGSHLNNPTVAESSSFADALSTTTNDASVFGSSPSARITGADSEAIGPSLDASPVVSNEGEAGKMLAITLLLHTGARHPYRIDERYLGKRNVAMPETLENGRKDPYSISVYTLKELILREWREEWEAQPSSPSSIRLIYFGRLLDDKTPLKDCRFNEKEANVVHMTVRPQDMIDEEDAAKGKGSGRDRDGGESTAGCRCVIL